MGKAGGQGFEPRLTVPKTVVLPLDDPPSPAGSGPENQIPGRTMVAFRQIVALRETGQELGIL